SRRVLFRSQIVDAVGGVRVCVAKPTPVPRQQVPAGVLKPGCRRLSGREALWYGRSRTGSSDYARMSRQKCLIWALARQAGPLTVLRSFERLSGVFKRSVSTDVPRRLLPPLVDLAAKIRNAEITSLQFVPPVISTGRPDYGKIRRMAGKAIRDSESRIALPAIRLILDRKSTRLNSSHVKSSYAVFCLKKKI